MPSSRDFFLAQCQATLFTPEAEVSTARLLSRLFPRWLGLFDGEPVILPLPDAVPKDIPRAIFESRSGEWRCECASGRINLFWKQPAGSTANQTLQRAYGALIPLLTQYVEFVDSRIGRLAAVASRYVTHPSPSRYLAGHFCKERWLAAPFNRPESFELHAHKRFPLGGHFQVNSWVRNRTGKLTAEGSERDIILVEQDFNTLAEEQAERSFSLGEVSQFFEAAGPGFDEVLNLYYPTNGD